MTQAAIRTFDETKVTNNAQSRKGSLIEENTFTKPLSMPRLGVARGEEQKAGLALVTKVKRKLSPGELSTKSLSFVADACRYIRTVSVKDNNSVQVIRINDLICRDGDLFASEGIGVCDSNNAIWTKTSAVGDDLLDTLIHDNQ